MKRPGTDVPLHDGEGFMVKSTHYKSHMKARDKDRQEIYRPQPHDGSTSSQCCRNHIAPTTRQ
jgi:hypothetical protein